MSEERDLPSGWTQVKVGDVADLIRGVTYKKAESSSVPKPGMVPILRATNIQEGHLTDSDLVFVPTKCVSPEQFLQIGDIIVATSSGSSTVVGKSAPVKADWRGSFGAFCAVLRAREMVDRRYLRFFVASDEVRDRWSGLARGTNINNLKVGDIESTVIPLAPLPEQDRIVAAIEEHSSHLDAARSSLLAALKRIPLLKQATLALAVEDGQQHVLGDLLEGIVAGKSFQTDGKRAAPDEWGVIKVSAMTWGRFLEGENKRVPPSVQIDPRFEIVPGDVLLSRANTSEYVGATVYVERCRTKLLLSDKSMRLQPSSQIEPRWLVHALNSPVVRRQMSLIATGTSDSMRNISQEKVRRLELRVPPISQQRALVERIDRQLTLMDSLAGAINHSLKRSETLRRSTLDRGFSGRLGVPTIN